MKCSTIFTMSSRVPHEGVGQLSGGEKESYLTGEISHVIDAQHTQAVQCEACTNCSYSSVKMMISFKHVIDSVQLAHAVNRVMAHESFAFCLKVSL